MKAWILWFGLLTASVAAQGWPSAGGFDGPKDLLRAARDIRLDLQDLGQVRFSGGPNFGPGGLNGFNGTDINQLSSAASYFERACMRVEDPRETLPAYQRLHKAYQRAWRANPYGTASVRDISKLMGRLEQFYAALEQPTTD